jgi:MerR family copper efflux transcriptional regulator
VNGNDPTTYLRSAQLAALSGVSTDTLRHYERKGLLRAGRSTNGYREYPPQSKDRVRLVQHALSVGFTLDELARLLKMREQGGTPCKEVRALAAAKLGALEEQLRGLSLLRNELRVMLQTWDAKLAGTRKGEQARLLDMLAAPTPALKRASSGVMFGAQRKGMHRRATTRAHSR